MLVYEKDNKKRNASTQSKLDSMDKHREGYLNFTVSGISGRTVPVEVCSCIVCDKPAIMMDDKRFVCRGCIFPLNP